MSFDGTVRVDAEVDLADALDLEEALRAGARQQADLGSTESLDVRRSIALGDLARRQLAFGFDSDQPNDPGRGVDLVVHISEDALTGADPVGRCGNTRSPVSVEQIRDWCGNPDATINLKPVVDLNDHIHVEAYEAPDRLKEQNALVDVHCVFPNCTKPAARCDCDHNIPLRRRRHDVFVQHRAVVPTTPPREDPLRVGLRDSRPRHLPVDQPQRHPGHPRPPRHPPRLTTQPHTPARTRRPGDSACPQPTPLATLGQMSETYDVYEGEPGSAENQDWQVLVEYSNRGDAKPPTLIVFQGDSFATREEALAEAERQATDFDPPDPFSPQGRMIYRDGDGYLTIVQGAMSTFHFSVRVVRFLGEQTG